MKKVWQNVGCGVGACWITFGLSMDNIIKCLFFVLGVILSVVSWSSVIKDARKNK